MIGHNSVQVPHDGKLQAVTPAGKIIPGAKFKAHSFFRPAAMSVALNNAGIIPGTHVVRDFPCTALLRHRSDKLNLRPSVNVAF